MENRVGRAPLHIVMSAYACEPGVGSEPEVGWRWAIEASKHHRVTVVTREGNRARIEAHRTESAEGAEIRFVYVDLGLFWLKIKKMHWLGIKLYYVLWQRRVRRLIKALVDEQRVDIVHHTTFVSFRSGAAIWGHGAKTVWGPIGGAEGCCLQLLWWRQPRFVFNEIVRGLSNCWELRRGSGFARRSRRSDAVIGVTPEMMQQIERFTRCGYFIPAIRIDLNRFQQKGYEATAGPLRLLFSGRLILLKGPYLAVEALKQADPRAQLTFLGGGGGIEALKKLVRRLDLGDRVTFHDRIRHEDIAAFYRGFDVLIFPSLHDSGGFVVLEAMACGLPVICLDRGGPGHLVAEGCGVKVPAGGRSRVVADLARAISGYARDRRLLEEHGTAARNHVAEQYDWSAIGGKIDGVYEDVMSR